MTMQRHLKLYRLPETTKTEGLRKLKATDIPEACRLLNKYLEKYDLVPVFTEEDFLHWFLPRENIIDTYIVEKPASTLTQSPDSKSNKTNDDNVVLDSPTKKDNSMVITDMVSFYTLPSTVMSHPTHNKLKAAYSFYNVSTVTPWVDLIGDALILARKVSGLVIFPSFPPTPYLLYDKVCVMFTDDGNRLIYFYFILT